MRDDLLVIKAGSAFLCARVDGDIRRPTPERVRRPTPEGQGLYFEDGRFLSELRVSLGGADPVLLSSSVESGYRAVVSATNPPFTDASGQTIPADTLCLRRTLLIDGRLHLLIELESFLRSTVTVELSLALGADFADLFEVRGAYRRPDLPRPEQPQVHDETVAFARHGEDGVTREALIDCDPAPAIVEADIDSVHVRWKLDLRSRTPTQILVAVTPSVGGSRPRAVGFKRAAEELDRQGEDWLASCTQVSSANELVQGVLDASTRDLHALMTPAPGGEIPAAGIPWYVAPFGRDSLLTALEALMLRPQMARYTLEVLAGLQATQDDPWRDAEPGKILHELRAGELARAGLIPHTPYYGTVDATPLFVALAGCYFRWTADLETLSTLTGAIDAALDWIDRYGDQDGDGFIEYQRRSPMGLLNQGWKDWDNSVVHADGTLAEGPIALVEAQGYVYLAKTQIATVYDALGNPGRARELRSQAQALRDAFNEAFWNPQEGTFALALDGHKRQVASVTSNPGHCLYCGIVEDRKAAMVAERLMAPDMFSGWGIRTLSARSAAYNPMSYHNGSVWPHDNALIAAGLKRYGYHESTARIASAIFEIAARSRDRRLAELYCGFDRAGRGQIVGYPVACMPQAWAAAAPFMLLEAMLGLEADAPNKRLSLVQPRPPDWIGTLALRGLRVGAATVKLAISEDGSASLRERDGELEVVALAAAHGMT